MTEPMDPKKETLRASLSARLKKSRGYFWSVFPWPEQFFEREEGGAGFIRSSRGCVCAR